MKIVGLVFLALMTAGCQHVEPWQRGTLARPEMSFESDALHASLKRQVFYSKESASGGAATAGVGCGCN